MTESEDVIVQIDMFRNSLESDKDKVFASLDAAKVPNYTNLEELFKVLNSDLRNTSCFDFWTYILRHLCMAPRNPFVKYKYMLTIDKIIAQVLRQKGTLKIPTQSKSAQYFACNARQDFSYINLNLMQKSSINVELFLSALAIRNVWYLVRDFKI